MKLQHVQHQRTKINFRLHFRTPILFVEVGVAVEHTLAHVGQWQGRRARYLGIRKNLFDLRRYAVVHNLHVLSRSEEFLQAA